MIAAMGTVTVEQPEIRRTIVPFDLGLVMHDPVRNRIDAPLGNREQPVVEDNLLVDRPPFIPITPGHERWRAKRFGPGWLLSRADLDSDDYEIGGASLHYHDHGDTFYLHVRTKADVDETDPTEHPTVLGVDLGIENLAVTSTTRFWSGGYLNHRRDEYERVRGSLQQTGTESAHQTIKRIGQRESRWAEDHLLWRRVPVPIVAVTDA